MTGEAGTSRYAIYERIASGGMASVHFGMLRGPSGFRRVVAIKRLHAQFAHDPEFVGMLLDEARLASRIVHPNVAATLDVVHEGDEVLLVLEYVAGEALSRLLSAARKTGDAVPPAVAVGIASGLLHGLHAAHEARDDRGELYDLVHRDVSPQNVLVGVDGVPKVVDFGVAKATGRSQVTREGELKGKLPYMAPEQVRDGKVSRQSDVWAASVVLWEMLVGERLFSGDSDGHIYSQVVTARIRAPGASRREVPEKLDAALMRGLRRDPAERYATAREMSLALEEALAPATPAQIGGWVESVAGDAIGKRAALLAEIQGRNAREVLAPTVPGATPASRPTADRGRRSRLPLAATAGLLVLVAAAISLAAYRRGSSAPAVDVATSTTSATTTPANDGPGAAPVAIATVEPAAAPAATEPQADAPAPPAREATHPPRGARVHATHAASATPPRGDKCRTIDSAGIWHVKPECL